jgi:putative membrane protein
VVILTKHQADRIEAAVKEAETHTSSEIVVGIVPCSGDDRGMAAIAGALIFALVAGIGPTIWWNLDRPTWAGIAIAVALLVFWLCDRFDLGLRCLPARLLIKDARRTARAIFVDHAIDSTPERNAILLFISRAERYVEILPDRAAAAAIEPAAWARIVEEFRHCIRNSDIGEAAAAAIAAIGRQCAAHFPVSGANPDRLPDRPIQS